MTQPITGDLEIGRMTVLGLLALSGPGVLVAFCRQAQSKTRSESQLGARPKPAMRLRFLLLFRRPFPAGTDTPLTEIAEINCPPTSHATRRLSRLSAERRPGEKIMCALQSAVCLPSAVFRLGCLTLSCLHRSPLFHPKIRLADPSHLRKRLPQERDPDARA